METNYIPKGYNHVIPYLVVSNASGFISFMKEVFNAEEVMRHMRDEQSVMHAEMKIIDSFIMVSDATEAYPALAANMFVYVPDADAAYASAIANGATSITAMADQPYGRTGGFTDPFGNTWWVTTNKNQ